ncbi:ATP-binding protein, partial [Streptomyces sp. I8-5]
SGRGLMLVDRLADLWGVESRGSGKCVWCEFVIPAHE